MTNHHLVRFAASLAVIAGGATLAPLPARAQGGGFGAPGQIVIRGDFEGHLRNGWELRLHPAIDYFIANNVSIGGVVGLQYNSGPSTTTVELGVRAGYNLAIVNQVTFWPTAGIFYSHFSNDMTSGSSTFLEIFAPFLYHIVPHFFVGAGPIFDLSLDNNGNGYGLQTVIGGWF
ncbi:MAG TPA: hypothetical protein VFH68_00760 [Polyangia bacterium]|jgi:hypothetical protein|nr:hypothetical protein [Polyangia bacterium]